MYKRQVHGGPDKALHHFPAEHYASLRARFPQLDDSATAGQLGENLSTRDVTEDMICIGDVFGCGELRIQVTQPRRPCWKINQRLGVKGAAAHVRQAGITGWYYRVTHVGELGPGAVLTLCERTHSAPTVAEFQKLTTERRPSLSRLSTLAELRQLPETLRRKLRQRVEWLKHNG